MIRGLEALPRKGVILVGEVHGTKAMPSLFGEVVEWSASHTSNVVVGLELPRSLQSALDASSGDTPERLLNDGFWTGLRDGRSSEAMVGLLQCLLRLRPSTKLVAIDRTGPNRERDMAMALLAAKAAHGAELAVALVGNLHASKASTIEALDLVPMGAHVAAYEPDLVSLNMASRAGYAWFVGEADPDGRPRPIAGVDQGDQPFIQLQPDEIGGYDGVLYIGEAEASPPAVPLTSF